MHHSDITVNKLVEELRKYKNICFYPSSGTDLSDLDYFCSGRLPKELRKNANGKAEDWKGDFHEPEAFVHSDVNFYMEFESGEDFDLSECGIHSPYEILGFEQLGIIEKPNRINGNLPFSGQCFKYILKLWGKEKPVVLIICLCENEFVATEIFMKNNLAVSYAWSKNWNGGRTYGTWLGRVASKLGIKLFYTDWLCIPGLRGEPDNSSVYEEYPDLVTEKESVLTRTDNHWIEEGVHGWVDEFTVSMAK